MSRNPSVPITLLGELADVYPRFHLDNVSHFSFLKMPRHRGKDVCMPPNLLLHRVWRHLVLDILKDLLGSASCAIV